MKPDKPGIWEWFNLKGERKLVEVFNCNSKLDPYLILRVFWNGGYYNVHDESVGTIYEQYEKAEWPDNWGKRIGDNHSLPVSDLYLHPSIEEFNAFYSQSYSNNS